MENQTTALNLNEYFAYWKQITANNTKVSSHIFLLHELILGRDPKNSAFTPITNKNKLYNGQKSWDGLEHAICILGRRLSDTIKQSTATEQKMIELSHADKSILIQRLNAIKSR